MALDCSAIAGGTPFLQVVFDSLAMGLVLQDAAGKIIAANPAAERMLGLTLNQMLGISSTDPTWRALHEDGSPFPGDTHPAMQALRSGESVNDVVMGIFNPATRENTWISVSATPIRDAATHQIVAVYAVFQDISLQKQIEERLHDKDAEFRAAVETSSDGFWIADLQGHLLEVNQAYCTMSGYTQAELLELSIDALDVHDDAAEVAARMQRIVQSGGQRFVTQHKARGGRRWPVEVVASYSPVAGGRLFCFLRDLTEQNHASELIWHQANFDRLTGLPNRALFFDRLSQECSAARRSGNLVALLFADLDSFKPVNDHHGHDAGDVVLKTVATRWLGCVRDTDTIARLGGDEFAVIVGDLNDAQEAAAIAAKLVVALHMPIALPKGASCQVGASVGIAIYPHNAREMDSLLQAADKAMYDCKAAGRNTYGFSMACASDTQASDHWLAFTDAHLIGVAEIDAQHRQLVRMVNEINFEMSVNAPDAAIRPRFDALLQFIVHHFQTEQGLMALHRYPDAQSHAGEHAQLIAEWHQIVQKRGREGDLLVLQRMKDWLVTHIQNADRALGQFLNENGVR